MKQILVIYDDRIQPGRDIQSITGQKSFGETIFKRRMLKDLMAEQIMSCANVLEMIPFTGHAQRLVGYVKEDTVIVHLFSNIGIQDAQEFHVLMQKASYIKERYSVIAQGATALGMFESLSSYQDFIGSGAEEDEKSAGLLAVRMKEFVKLESKAFYYLGEKNQFLRFITSGFEARFFNNLEGNEYTVTKKSKNIQKIKSEYNYYHLLPEEMKMWFVMPFHYTEKDGEASYTMERYHMTDIAIRFVHGAVTTEEFHDIMRQLFHFIHNRTAKTVTKDEYEKLSQKLYIKKVEERMELLKAMPEFDKFDLLISKGTSYGGLEDIVDHYKKCYASMHENRKTKATGYQHVVGHGDLCFSNILYQKDASILRLIDPKGAQVEEELYTNPYYDLAKLSHSICGMYDFFNSGLYGISLNENMRFELTLDGDTQIYSRIFRDYLEENGYDYQMVRLYEASLFLSMLPLHMDREQKVFAFILNAIRILEEIS